MLISTLVLIYLGVVGAAISDRQTGTVKQADKTALDSGRSLEFADALNSTNCGDLLVAKGGFITYKQSKNDERCIWTIRTHKWETKFLMHESTFVSESDHVLIYSVDENGDLQVKAKIDKETGREIIGVLGPLLFLSFTSTKGQEFLLEYFAFGYNEATGYTYGHAHLDNPSGNLVWPEKPVDYYQNTFSTFTVSPNLVDTRLQLTVDTVDLVSLSRGCQNNFLTVHQLFESGFVLRLRYCEPDLLSSAEISSSSPLLIIYRAAVGPNNVGISFSWDESKKN